VSFRAVSGRPFEAQIVSETFSAKPRNSGELGGKVPASNSPRHKELPMNSPAIKAPALRRALAGATGYVIPFPQACVPRDLDLAAPLPGAACSAPDVAAPGLAIRPGSVARRQSAAWRGIGGDVVRVVRHEPFDISFRAPCHLLIAHERGLRHQGETVVEGLPHSSLRDFSQKLTIVPAGTGFRERQDPRGLARATYLYVDPAGPLIDPEIRFGEVTFAPRLLFDNQVLWETALKLKALIEIGSAASRLYAEALGVVLAHELMRLNNDVRLADRPARGGLAAWQQKAVIQYLEENVAKQISLATLAELAQLSPFHFCRAFKQSFGMPPHRYHSHRRVERAKTLLARGTRSVTDIAIEIGFSETSSFTAAFHKITGLTPTSYRRSMF
jgi:AraC family transcriptional regulator